jgi:hypothetical protein
MHRVPVKSSVLAGILYLPELRVLEIEFRSGPVHQYFDVPEPNYNGLLAAKSKGNYFNLNIRNRFSSKEKAGSLKAAQSLS